VEGLQPQPPAGHQGPDPRATGPARDVGQLPSAGRRLPGIEGLRAIAALSILVLHTWLLGSSEPLDRDGIGGEVFFNLGLGVVLFFTLSGFLLYRPFAAAIARAREPGSVGRYLRNRALRILPAYLVILLILALVLQTTLVQGPDGALVPGAITDPAELVRTGLMVQNYDPGTLGIGIGPAWSLAVEAVFYLALPVLVLAAAIAARRVPSRSRRVAILLGPPLLLLIVGVTGKLAAAYVVPGPVWSGFEPTWHAVVERSFWAQADLFAFGMVAAVVHTEVVDGRLRLPAGWRPTSLLLAGGIVLVSAATLGGGQVTYKPQNTAVALAMGLLLAVVVFPGPKPAGSLLTRALETRWMVFAGLISYSVFLWQEPLIHWLREHGLMREGWDGFVWNLTLTLVVVGVLSFVTYRLVELPALRLKKRDRQPAASMEPAQEQAAP